MNNFAALNGQVVTQRIANICADKGHATHTVDGVDTGICPRCGDVKATITYVVTPKAEVRRRRISYTINILDNGKLVDVLDTFDTEELAWEFINTKLR
jgi:hypothetical protein